MSDNLLYWRLTGGAPDSSQNTATPSYADSLEYTYTQDPETFQTGLASPLSPLDPGAAVHASNPSHMMPSYGLDAWGNPGPLSGTASMHGADRFSSPGSVIGLSPGSDTLAPAVSGDIRAFRAHRGPLETCYPQGSASVHHNHASTQPPRSAVHVGEVVQQLHVPTIENEYDQRNAVDEDRFCKWAGCSYHKPFNRKEDVSRHVNEVHLRIKPYKCPMPDCNAEYSRRYKIKDHISNSHPSFAQR